MPQRIQLRRTAGWLMPEGAIVVSRPSRGGNPFQVTREVGVGWSLRGIPEQRGEWTGIGRELACAYAKGLYRSWLHGDLKFDFPLQPPASDDIAALAGHDLACWCPLDFACHADVLLYLANGKTAQLAGETVA